MTKAPFPYHGGKSRVAELVWKRLGDVDNYCEPFMGSAAMLLARPHAPRVETANDYDCYVANFWRATSKDPDAVAEHVDWPVNEVDLHARHRWLVLSDEAKAFRDRMRTVPEYFDPKIAGWWCWGAACWIGGAWCQVRDSLPEKIPAAARGSRREGPKLAARRPALSGDNPGSYGKGVHSKGPTLSQQVPRIGDGFGRGVHSKGPNLYQGRPQLGDAFARGRGVHGHDVAITCENRHEWLLGWFRQLRDRLRTVRVCCGDWLRICDSPSVTTRLGITGLFLDPPYSAEAGRDMSLYACEDGDVAHRVREYCLERGDDPKMRIALCGYEGEGHEALEAKGWEVVAWRANGGYGNRSEKGRANRERERIWFSPHCLRDEVVQGQLFGDSE